MQTIDLNKRLWWNYIHYHLDTINHRLFISPLISDRHIVESNVIYTKDIKFLHRFGGNILFCLSVRHKKTISVE